MKRIIFIFLCTCASLNFALAQETDNPGLIKRVTNWYSENISYTSITALMTIESSFIPFPSEVVVPPAAYVAGDENSQLNWTGNHFLNVLLVIFFASLGAMLGAIINYLLSIWLGRPIIYKFADSKLGHLCLLSGEKIQKAETYFCDHGKVSTFVGRLIPGIRQLISIPAGLARMPFGIFLLYTFLGAFIWNTVLALLGYLAHGQADLIDKYNHELSLIIIALVVLVALMMVAKKLFKKNV